ncbi:MAG: hypothetical protein AABX61_00795 [Nanoarchaeota archaeon]
MDFIAKRDFSKLIAQSGAMFQIIKELKKEDFFGTSPPSVFIGHNFYPNLNVGILSPPAETEDAWIYDSPNFWTEQEFSIKQIALLRSALINSRFNVNIKDVRKESKFLDAAKEIGIASKPVDVEIKLKKSPEIKFDFEKITMPMGPRAGLKQITITENIKVDNKVERVVNDTDLKSAEALNYLYENGFDENTLTKLLSIGVLGLKKNRKLVPTKWSITATDDTLGKSLIEKIKNSQIINDYRLYIGSYLGNYYFILMFPEVWQYELFEGYLPRSLWNQNEGIRFTTDSETYYGRKNYASTTVGGYYSSRLSTLEYLSKIKKQASCLVIRFETPEYNMPLGVFVVRNAARKTLYNNPLIFETKEDLLMKTGELIKNRFNYNIDEVFKQSKLLKSLTQLKLFHFFN